MDWGEHYTDEIGLWSSAGPGHTIPTRNLDTVHAGPNAASRLLTAAQVGDLAKIDVARVLFALREMQWSADDGKRGCIKWYWEEDQPYDTNAAFFTGLSLIVLRKLYYDELNPECREALDEILCDLSVWFTHTADYATYHYPNKYMGDLVCGWLLVEILGRTETDATIATHMHRAADYWLDDGWGWGEHLSDIYTGVCLNELSVLLLLSERLPEDLRQRYTDLIAALLDIEDAYDGGPRVPALRSYAFQAPCSHTNYRDRVKAWAEIPENYGNSPDLGNLLHGLGWHDRMPERKPAQTDPIVPCFGGAVAHAQVLADIRIGSTTRFPVMPSAEHPTWGLSWQCFPVAFSRGETDWGFLQWEAVENGVVRAHPANGGAMAHIPKSLTATTMPPVAGETFAIQRGGDVVVLRRVCVIPRAWESLTDRFRLVGQTADATAQHDAGWWRLSLPYPERTVSVHRLDLSTTAPTEETSNDFDGTDWSTTYRSPDLHTLRVATQLWAFSISGEVGKSPRVTVLNDAEPIAARNAEETVREIRWVWPSTMWHLRIDPLADRPIVEI